MASLLLDLPSRVSLGCNEYNSYALENPLHLELGDPNNAAATCALWVNSALASFKSNTRSTLGFGYGFGKTDVY